MLTLESRELQVAVIDPQADLARCGSRYVVGGYIYQVNDASLGPLLSGPQYPNPTPDVFHGQGAPEQFVRVLNEEAALGDEVAVIGVGRVRRTGEPRPMFARHNPEVLSFLPWAIEASPESLQFRTEDSLLGKAYRLTRTLSLQHRSLISETLIENSGELPISIEWYAHPFFPPCPDRVCCQLSLSVSMPENAGYQLNSHGFIEQKAADSWDEGYYQALTFGPTEQALRVLQKHPKLGQITAETSFAPQKVPVWGNDRTFSFEPYLTSELVPGAWKQFSIAYHF